MRIEHRFMFNESYVEYIFDKFESFISFEQNNKPI